MVNQLTQFVRRHIKLLAALALIICAVLQILLILYFILIHQSHSNAK